MPLDIPVHLAFAAPLASAATTIMVVFLSIVLLLGYVVLWVIWRMFFRGRGD